MNPEQYDFESTISLIGNIASDKNGVIAYIKSLKEKISTVVDEMSDSQSRGNLLNLIRANNSLITAEKGQSKISESEFKQKRDLNMLLISTLRNNTFSSSDDIAEAIFENRNKTQENFNLLNNIFSFTEKPLDLNVNPENYFNFAFAFANDIGSDIFVSKEWNEIEPLINYLFAQHGVTNEELYGAREDDEFNLESKEMEIIVNNVRTQEIANSVAKDDKYLIALKEEEDMEAANAAETGKPPSKSGRPGASSDKVYRPNINKKDENFQKFTPADIYARSVNRSKSFFQRLKSTPDILDQINFINKNLDEASKISITSHYAPFSVISGQESAIEIKNIEGTIQAVKNHTSFAGLIAVARNILKSISNEFLNNLRTLQDDGQDPFYKIEKIRYNCAMHLDDLSLAMKLRDLAILDKVKKLRQQDGLVIPDNFADSLLFEKLLKRPTSDIRNEFLATVKYIVFYGVDNEAYLSHLAKKHLGEALSAVPDNIVDITTKASQQGNYYIQSKIDGFFSLDNNSRSLSVELITSFAMDTVIQQVSQSAKGMTSTSWTYVKCPTCTKSIYYSQRYSRFYDTKKHEKTEDVKPINMDVYLPFRNDNTLITEDDFMFQEDGSDRYFYENEDAYNWTQIKDMISSSDEDEHIKGLHLRMIALEELGAKRTRKNYDIRSMKTKCPFEGGKLPATIESAKSSKKNLAISDFTCGMSFDFDQLNNATEKITPHDINVAPLKPGAKPKEDLDNALNSLVQKGIIKNYEKESFNEELKRRMSGGWKNSNKIFQCPCKFEYNNNIDNLSNYKFLAFPVTGVVNRTIPVDYEPPTDISGNKLEIQDGTASYVVCGENASLSSFVRDPSDPGSIQGLFRRYYDEFRQTGKSYKIYELLNALVAFGVDFNDVLPYTKYLSDYLMSKSARRISPVDNAALREIVKFGSISLYGRPPASMTDASTFDIIKDLKLTCPTGHRFTIESSVNFGKSHHGVYLNYNQENKRKIKNSNILTTTGIANFNSTLELLLVRQNNNFMSEISDDQAVRYFDISKWEGKSVKKLNKFYFTANGKKYVFNDINNSFIWIKEKNNKLHSLELEEVSDRGTTKIIDVGWVRDRGPSSEKGGGDGIEDYEDLSDNNEIGGGVASSSNQDEYVYDAAEDPGAQRERLPLPIFKEMLNAHHLDITKIFKGTLNIIRDFSEVATRLEVYGTLFSDPVMFYDDKFKDKRIAYEGSISNAARKFIEYTERSMVSDQQPTDNALVDSIVKEFENTIQNSYYKHMMMQDLRLLDILGESISIFSEKNLYINISEAIIEATSKVLNTNRYRDEIFKNISRAIFEEASIKEIKNSFDESGAKVDIDNAMLQINSIMKSLRISAVKTIKGVEKPGVVDLSTLKEVTAPETSRLSISNLKASEYLARIHSMSSAIYMADSFVNLSNKYLSSASEDYIGYDITLDEGELISSRDGIIAASKNNGKVFVADYYLSQITPTVGTSQASSIYRNNGPASYLIKYKNILNKIVEDYRDILSELETIVSSRRYLNESLDIMRETILSRIETSTYNDEMKKISTNLVKNCMVVPPITTIDLKPGKKYDLFYQKYDKFRKLPLFRAPVLKSTDVTNIAYLIATSEGTVFDIVNVKSQVEPKRVIVLSRNLEGVAGAQDISSEIDNQEIIKNGWKLYNMPAPSGKDPFEQRLVSMFYHPYTFGIDEDGNYTIPTFSSKDFYNSHVNINTSSGFSIGKFPSGASEDPSKLYPPSNLYSHTSDSPGIIIPIDYRASNGMLDKEWKNDQQKIFPLFDARIPVNIPTGGNDSIIVDISDFFARDPEDLAKKYLNQIYDLYIEFNEKLSKLKEGTPSDPSILFPRRKTKMTPAEIDRKSRNLKKEYMEKIRDIYSKYKNLPLLVRSSECISLTPTSRFTKQVDSGRTGFVPMIDYVTINKIISIDGFSQEFGGHALWDRFDTEYKNKVILALRSILINMNGLDSLSKELNQKINSFKTIIKLNVKNIKIPEGFITLSFNSYDLLSPYGDPLDTEVGFYTKIYRAAAKALLSIQSKDKALSNYKIEDEEIINLSSEISYHLIASKIPEDWKPGVKDNFYVYQNINSSNELSTPHRHMKDKNYYNWKYTTGRHYNILSDLDEDSFGGRPPARLCLYSDIFPFDSDASTRATDMKNIQNPDHEKILGQFNIHASKIIRGLPDSTELYTDQPQTPSERAKDLKNVKATGGVRVGSAVAKALKYAAKNMLSFLPSRSNVDSSDANQKKASYSRFISKKAELTAFSAPKPISKMAAEISNMRSVKNIASDYYLRNISLAAIAALVSQIART